MKIKKRESVVFASTQQYTVDENNGQELLTPYNSLKLTIAGRKPDLNGTT